MGTERDGLVGPAIAVRIEQFDDAFTVFQPVEFDVERAGYGVGNGVAGTTQIVGEHQRLKALGQFDTAVVRVGRNTGG